MELSSIRRYPVKSMGGEALDQVVVDRRGLAGDRWFAVEDAEGRFASGKDTRRFRRRDAVFDYVARVDGDAVRVGRLGGLDTGATTWLAGGPELDDELSRAMGAEVWVRPEQKTGHQDGGQVSLVGTASLDWCHRRWGVDADPRRLRVNLVVRTDEPFVEETWVGGSVRIGDCLLRVVERVERCRTVDLDQDGASATGRLLKPLSAEREMSLAVYADVEVAGTIRVGDEVRSESERKLPVS